MTEKNSGPVRALPLPRGVLLNARNKIDAKKLVASLPDASIDLAFFDPQYRTGLDYMKFGNEGTRQKDRYQLPQMSDTDIQTVIEDIVRALKRSGHLMLWGDTFMIGQGTHQNYIRRLKRVVQVVDVLSWNKLVFGMGKRFRRQTEYLVVFQKVPIRVDRCWTDHGMPDSWPEMKDSNRHTHAKPHQLTERLIRATTKRGGLVLDPCAGGYGVLTACQMSGRDFIGGDLIA